MTEPSAKMFEKCVNLTREGVGDQDSCWVWRDGLLYQIDPLSWLEPIHVVSLQCYKGDWYLFLVKSQIDWTLWNDLMHQKLLAQGYSQKVVSS